MCWVVFGSKNWRFSCTECYTDVCGSRKEKTGAGRILMCWAFYLWVDLSEEIRNTIPDYLVATHSQGNLL